MTSSGFDIMFPKYEKAEDMHIVRKVTVNPSYSIIILILHLSVI